MRECGTGRGHPLRHPPSPAFGSSSGSRRRNGTGWSRNGWTAQGQLNRSPPFQCRAGCHGQARCWFDTRHEPSGWRQALPWACPVRPPAVTVSWYSLQWIPAADLSVRVGVIAPTLPVLRLRQRKGTTLGPVSSAACRVRAAHSLSSEAPIPLPGNNPAMVPATVAAIPCLPLPAVDLGTPPGDVAEPARRPSASPHDRRSCNRRETAPRLPRSPS